MGVADRLRTDDVAGGGTPAPLVGGESRGWDPTRANAGTADVRYKANRTMVITLHSAGAADSFKLGAYNKAHASASNDDEGAFVRTDTIAFVVGTNCASTDLQTALRTATGDTALTVSGSTDTGPFTVTYINKKGQPELVAHTCVDMSVQIAPGALTYDDPTIAIGGLVFDQESSRGINVDVPLGYSIVTDGTGQTAGTTLVPPTIDSAVGGSGQVVIAGTEVASGGTSAVVLYAIQPLGGGSYVVVDTEDADADVTVTGLTAGNYVLVGHTQTAPGRVSRPSAPTYFTVS